MLFLLRLVVLGILQFLPFSLVILIGNSCFHFRIDLVVLWIYAIALNIGISLTGLGMNIKGLQIVLGI